MPTESPICPLCGHEEVRILATPSPAMSDGLPTRARALADAAPVDRTEQIDAITSAFEKGLLLSPGDARVLIGQVLAAYRFRSIEIERNEACNLLERLADLCDTYREALAELDAAVTVYVDTEPLPRTQADIIEAHAAAQTPLGIARLHARVALATGEQAPDSGVDTPRGDA